MANIFLWDDFEELSPREQDAIRALKSAMLGLFFCPLQIYTAWLVLLVVLAEQPLRSRYHWYAIGAAIVLGLHLPVAAGLMILIWSR